MSINLDKMPKLGFGLMRLPQKDDAIDMDHLCHMVDAYMAAGMNYFDTAYVYHGENSEKVIKDALVSRYPRDSFMLATKLPAWCMKEEADRDRIFNEQLERCGVDYFDFYLLHSIEDGGNGETYEKLNCFSWGLQKKAEGKIRHFGFSFHGSPAYLTQVLDAHPEVDLQRHRRSGPWHGFRVHCLRTVRERLPQHLPIIDLLKDASKKLDA